MKPDYMDHIEAITLITGTKKYPMEKQSENIWNVIFQIPYLQSSEHMTYRLSIDGFSCTKIGIRSVSMTVRKHRYTFVSYHYIMADSAVERIWWHSGFSTQKPLELAEHFLDIVSRCSKFEPPLECCVQIENFSKKIRLNKQTILSIYRYIQDFLDKTSALHWLLVIVVVANLFGCYSSAAESIPATDIEQMLKSIRNFKLSDLTSAASVYMPVLILELCKRAQGKCHCFLMIVSATFPFLDEQILSDKLVAIIKERKKLVPDEIHLEIGNEVLQTFEMVYEKANSESDTKFLMQLLLHSPTTLAVKAYIFIHQRQSGAKFAENSVSKIMLESIVGSLRAFLKSPKRTSVEILDLWDTVEKSPKLVALAKVEFENAFICTVSKISCKDIERMKNVMVKSELFKTPAQHNEIIDSLARVRRPELHFFLFEVISHSKFRETADKTSLKWFILCLENAILGLKRENSLEKNLKELYSYLLKANEVSAMSDNEDLQGSITTTIVDFLRQFELKDILRSAKFIEELTENSVFVGQLFRSHVKALLDRQKRQNYHELLINLCGTNGEVRVNSQ